MSRPNRAFRLAFFWTGGLITAVALLSSALAAIGTSTRRIAAEFGVGVLIVTHDPSVWAECDRVLRLDDGRLVEERAAA